ncbi:hypothetical protein PSHT_01638 [Puccinia striiformis]|uniref:Fungal-type protein kinase domain-containing protein n=1 Tax=Puccinia striiformis TaxID=27350 RepID=A0A2S4WK02_9BASI|nr:hypothetical protein PSHT_01638 [Puccinia striiformis]
MRAHRYPLMTRQTNDSLKFALSVAKSGDTQRARPRPLSNNIHLHTTPLKAHHNPANFIMDNRTGDLQNSLRNILNSQDINTVEGFFGLERSTKVVASDDKYLIKDQFATMLSHVENAAFEYFKPLILAILANETKTNQQMYDIILKGLNNHSTASSLTPSRVRTGNTSSHTNYSGHLHHYILKSFIDQDHIHPAFRPQPDENFINEKCNEQLADTNQSTMLKWIDSLFECCTRLDQQSPNAQTSRIWRSHPNAYVTGIDWKRKLDGAITHRHAPVGNHIRDILVPFEIKNCKKYAQPLLFAWPDMLLRSLKVSLPEAMLLGNIVRNLDAIMELHRYRRAGLYGTHKQQKIQIKTKTSTQELVIEKNIFRARGICGRGTTCWEAHLSGDELQKYLIKDSWQPLDRAVEGEILCDVTAGNAPHVARYSHHEDVHVDDKRIDIESHVRGGIAFKKSENIPADHEPAPPEDTTNSSDAPSYPEEPENCFINRVHRRLILKDVGTSIWEVDSPVALLEALEGCIRGHQAILLAGYLHRDISINNLMVAKQTDDPARKSFVIDLDVAVDHRTQSPEDLHTRTGTRIFMSSNLLAGKHTHSFVDDLESFFWVLIWICIHHRDDKSTNINTSDWNKQDSLALGMIKGSYLKTPQLLTMLFRPQYKNSEPLICCVEEFAQIMDNSGVRTMEAKTLYSHILNIFRKAQGKLIVPAQ